jgi:hypothetical protein
MWFHCLGNGDDACWIEETCLYRNLNQVSHRGGSTYLYINLMLIGGSHTSDMSSTMGMSDRVGLSIPKPCFKPRWIHLLILELDANVGLTHDDKCMHQHGHLRLHRSTTRSCVEVAISFLTLSGVCVEASCGHQVYTSGISCGTPWFMILHDIMGLFM